MKRIIPFIAFACLTGFTATNGLPVMAGGCSKHSNKTAKIKCAEEDMTKSELIVVNACQILKGCL